MDTVTDKAQSIAATDGWNDRRTGRMEGALDREIMEGVLANKAGGW